MVLEKNKLTQISTEEIIIDNFIKAQRQDKYYCFIN